MDTAAIITITMFLATQTGALIWWASKTSNQLSNIETLVTRQNGRVGRLENKVFDLPN